MMHSTKDPAKAQQKRHWWFCTSDIDQRCRTGRNLLALSWCIRIVHRAAVGKISLPTGEAGSGLPPGRGIVPSLVVDRFYGRSQFSSRHYEQKATTLNSLPLMVAPVSINCRSRTILGRLSAEMISSNAWLPQFINICISSSRRKTPERYVSRRRNDAHGELGSVQPCFTIAMATSASFVALSCLQNTPVLMLASRHRAPDPGR